MIKKSRSIKREVKLRLNQLYSQRFSRAKKISRWLSRHPHIIRISLVGSMAKKRISQSSDIDLFIQVNPGRLWSTRFWVTFLIALLVGRPSQLNRAGKICLNWWATFNAPAQRGIKNIVLYSSFTKKKTLLPNWHEKCCRWMQRQQLNHDFHLKPGYYNYLSDEELALRHRRNYKP